VVRASSFSLSEDLTMGFQGQNTGGPNTRLTPSSVFVGLGNPKFDTDVAAADAGSVTHVPAKRYITKDSLLMSWASFGFVWMNAPFNLNGELEPKRNGMMPWLDKFTKHGNGVCVTVDRTSSPWWQRYAPCVDLVLFWAPKIQFLEPPDGVPLKSPPDGNTFFAMGEQGCAALEYAARHGHGILMRPVALRQPAKILGVAS
jgi:hypothetical protein